MAASRPSSSLSNRRPGNTSIERAPSISFPSLTTPRSSTLNRPTASTSLKRVSSLSSSLQDLTPALKTRKIETAAPSSADRLRAEKDLRAAESRISQLEREAVNSQSTVRELEVSLKDRDSRVARLEADRDRLLGRCKAAEQSHKDAESLWSAERERLTLEARIAKREREAEREAVIKDAAIERRRAHETEMLTQRAESLEGQVNRLQEELAASDEALTGARAETDEANAARLELSKRVEELSRSGGSSSEDAKIVREELKRQVGHLKTLEAANARLNRAVETLKTDATAASQLREQNRSLETRLRLIEPLRAELFHAQNELETLKQQRNEWLAFLEDDETGNASPVSVSRALAAARLEIAGLRERLGMRDAELSAREGIIGQLEERVAELEGDAQAATERLQALEDQLARETRFAALNNREIELLRAELKAIDAGDQDETATDNRLKDLNDLVEAQRAQASDLKRENDQLRGQIELQSSDTGRVDGLTSTIELKHRGKLAETLAEALRQNIELQKQATELNAEIDLLDREKASLEMTIERLERAVGRGEFNPETTRVLQFGDNPAAQDLAIRQSQLDSLKAENEALLERLQAREASHNASQPFNAPQATLDNLRREIAALEGKVEEREKARKRLAEQFQAKASELRKAIRSLFGFTLDARDGGRIRLTSVFAPTPDSHLVFEPDPLTGELRLLGGTGEKGAWDQSREIQGHAEFWIRERNCIPGFLAALTSEGYDARTAAGKSLGWTHAE